MGPVKVNKMTKEKKWVVMVSWEGLYDTYTEEYSGEYHDTWADAHQELVDAHERDIEGNIFTIKEVIV